MRAYVHAFMQTYIYACVISDARGRIPTNAIIIIAIIITIAIIIIIAIGIINNSYDYNSYYYNSYYYNTPTCLPIGFAVPSRLCDEKVSDWPATAPA